MRKNGLRSVLVSSIAAVIQAIMPAAPAIAQDGTATINVRPNLGTQPRDAFLVCLGTSSNRGLYGTKVTPSTGIVTFSGIKSNTDLVTTVSKEGFTGREAQWFMGQPATNKDMTFYMFTGSGGPACPAVSNAPPPTPSAVRVFVTPPTGTSSQGFYVCVGTSFNRAAYGTGVTPATGPVLISNLPPSGTLLATVQKTGFISQTRQWSTTPGQTVNVSVTMTPGSGGSTCPGQGNPTPVPTSPTTTEIKQEGTVITALPPGTAPVRLGEERLTQRGQFTGDVTTETTDCTALSNRNVMIGIEGSMRDTVIMTMKVSCTTVRDAITNERFIPRGNHRSSFEYFTRCSPGKVLVGLKGTVIHGQLRSFMVVCQKMGNDGRVTGETSTLGEIGKAVSTSFGPDLCSGGRSGRGLKTARGRMTDGLPAPDTPHPMAVIGIQLICEQPHID